MRNKRFYKKSGIAIILCLILSVVIGVGGAISFLTASDKADNKFTVGEVKIDLTEPKWSPDTDTNEDGTDDAVSNLVANQVVPKDPTITNTGKNNAYVQVPKEDGIKIADSETFEVSAKNDYQLFTYETNEGWTLVDQKIDSGDEYNYYLYAYDAALAPKESATLFDEVKFANITSEYNPDPLNVEITGYAIQSDLYNNEAADAIEAWNLYVTQNSWKWPSNPVKNHVSYFSVNNEFISSKAYLSADEEFVVDQDSVTADGKVAVFNGWFGDNGTSYENGTTVTINELYVHNDKGEIDNINPNFTEDIEWLNLDEGTDQIMLIPKEGSTTVINRGGQRVSEYKEGETHWFVYGLREYISKTQILENYIDVQGDGRIEYIIENETYANMDVAGTGNIINVYDRHGTDDESDDTLVESLRVVIFGDVNEDACAQAADCTYVLDEAEGISNWSDPNSDEYAPWMVKAIDISHDGQITKTDYYAAAQIIGDSSIGMGRIDQTNGSYRFNG